MKMYESSYYITLRLFSVSMIFRLTDFTIIEIETEKNNIMEK